MIIWGALIIPILCALFVGLRFTRRITPPEFAILLGVPTILIAATYFITKNIQTTAQEYWGGWVVKAEYYEKWDERVSCKHPIYCTSTTVDSKGIAHTYTYVCGHLHSYDVDVHPPHWTLIDSNSCEMSVSQGKFEELAKRWNSRAFVDLRRNYHSIDGDKYVATYDNNDNTIEITTTQHSYRNKVQASNSVFNFPKVDGKALKLFDHPKISGYYQPCILGDGGPTGPSGDKRLNFLNAKLGRKCKVRMYIICWKDRTMQTAIDQQNYWKNGNKNEVVVNIGVDKDSNVSWCYVFGWTQKESLKVAIRDFVMANKKLDLPAIVDYTYPQVESAGIIRRDFREFEYLDINPPTWVVVMVYLLTLVASIGIAIWGVTNDDSNQEEGRY